MEIYRHSAIAKTVRSDRAEIRYQDSCTGAVCFTITTSNGQPWILARDTSGTILLSASSLDEGGYPTGFPDTVAVVMTSFAAALAYLETIN